MNRHTHTDPNTLSTECCLVSWIGLTDHQCAEEDGVELGPVASAIGAAERFDRILLLTNYPFDRSRAYCEWLERKTGCVEPQLHEVELASPINYAEIYEKVSFELRQARLPRNGVELTFHLSPGTPAMAAIWIMLAKTRFPAHLIQTSRQRGLEVVDFSFDLASDFLPEYLQRSDARIERLADARVPVPGFEKIIHADRGIATQIERARRIAAFDVPVLILGSTGTGKELFAEAIHASSRRAAKPFLAVNCGAISRELANSELFGHRKGAFTGAMVDRPGHFREADGGTLFLDEIGDLPLDAQVRLLRALQEKEITPLGESRPVKVNVRIIAATHRDLQADVAAGRFREDLFHRLAVGVLSLPSLRDRGGDLGLLIDHFLSTINADGGLSPEALHKDIAPQARDVFLTHSWPGNVRELYHTLVRAAIWSQDRVITADDARAALLIAGKRDEPVMGRALGGGFDLQGVLDEVTRHYLASALAASGQRKKRAAELLGFANYQTFAYWLRKHGIESEALEADEEQKNLSKIKNSL
ncbi:two component, sigma54 specific, Fis family transcriptional regulator [Caballeronia calidae]|uniref:Two component, sigma54 specific, Fis family transcriptional regulator n=1 Tax=Caballeronia calidae TaxID=1777139 RepID=A0A158DZ07_9BURK|nr:sigma-54 dependent transcriptional regulator [Caballeronia calidae]SAK99794.1 two component, sigma54 specific, Fis family transcriptional regulator [Caballeronia calidae]